MKYIIFLVIFIIFILFSKKLEHFQEKKIKIKHINKPNNWNSLPFVKKLNIYKVNLTPQHSIYADKYRVKNLVKNIDGLHVAKTLKVIDNNNENLKLKELPSTCIIKSNNGSNDLIIIKNSKIETMTSKGKKYTNYKEWKTNAIKTFNKYIEVHYQYIKPVIFVEEYLGDNLIDYKFYCFLGEIKFIHVDSNRFGNHIQKFYDTNFKHMPELRKKNSVSNNGTFTKPKNFNKMKKIVNELAKNFEFARIDLYNIDGKIFFGEVTFTPDAGRKPFYPPSNDMKIGKYWNI